MSEEQENNAPRPRLILPGGAATDKPRTRLIAPATVPLQEEAVYEEEEYVEDTVQEEAPDEIQEESPVAAIPHVTPLAPPPQQSAPAEEESDEDLGEAEQGEFTVINEDTGETHTVPVRVSSMAPPAAESHDDASEEEVEQEPEQETQYAEPDQEEEAPDYGGYATYEEQQAAIAYEEAQQQAYYEQQQQARHPRLQVPQSHAPQVAMHAEAPQYQQQYAQPQHQQIAFPAVGGVGPAHHPQAPGHHYPQIAVSRGVPSWALILIGILTGFIIAVILFKFTDFGPMLRPIKSMME